MERARWPWGNNTIDADAYAFVFHHQNAIIFATAVVGEFLDQTTTVYFELIQECSGIFLGVVRGVQSYETLCRCAVVVGGKKMTLN